MSNSDTINVILIIICYALLLAYNHYLMQSGLIKMNWEEYKCNPAFIPFAKHYGYDPQKLMYECIHDIQNEAMPQHLAAINNELNDLESKANKASEDAGKASKDATEAKASIFSKAREIFSAFNNIIIEFQKLIQVIKTWASKMIALITTFLYFFDATMTYTLPSAGNSPLGQVAIGLCFHPETKMKLNDGSIVKMKDIEIGQTIKNGSMVCSTMKIKNFDNEGNIIEGLYEIPNGEDSEPIYVTGSHLIYDNQQKKFIQVKDHKDAKRADRHTTWFTCLITSDHLMVIGKNVFHDWEDNNGSKSKSLV